MRRFSVSASFVDTPWEAESAEQPLPVDFGRGSDEQYDGLAAVDALTINGPYNAAAAGDTPSRRAIFSCHPTRGAEESTCARQILTRLARRAYRGQHTPSDLDRLFTFYETGRKGRSFDAGIQLALQRLLASPKSVLAELAAGNGDELTLELLARVKVPVSIVLDAKSPPTPLERAYPRARVVRASGLRDRLWPD